MSEINLKKIIWLTVFGLIFLLLTLKLEAVSGNSEQNLSNFNLNQRGLNLTIVEFNDFLDLVKEFDEDVFLKKQKALEKSEDIKGVYMTFFTAASLDEISKKRREEIKKLLKETELNAVVIDVKEVSGPTFSNTLKSFVSELQQNDVWVIARIAALRDYSQILDHPEWYLKTGDSSLGRDSSTQVLQSKIWVDESGYFWLDPACQGVRNYILDISKRAVDFGFNELQFDYLRFPDRGDLKSIVYPCFGGGRKSETINDFYLKLCRELRDYKKDLILSISLFGHVAQHIDIPQTGQNLDDAIGKFDYLSFMPYPSHYFQGFAVPADPARGLPSLYLPYRHQELDKVVSNNPYQVVFRSQLLVSDYVASINPPNRDIVPPLPDSSFFEFAAHLYNQYVLFLKSQDVVISKIRPWLQDFNLAVDTARGIFYDAEKVRAQIEAAENAGSSGWLLWNPANVYTGEALKR